LQDRVRGEAFEIPVRRLLFVRRAGTLEVTLAVRRGESAKPAWLSGLFVNACHIVWHAVA
jgi:hypothetical protein